MEQKQKIIALLVLVGILAGGGIGYIWFAKKNISQDIAQNIEGKLDTTSVTNTGVVTAPGEEIAYVSAIEGSAKINRKGNESLILKNTPLQPGDVVTSDTGSTIEIIFVDNSFLRIVENSKITIASKNQVELENGGLWARILKPLQDTSVFTINATNLSAEVRGTAVFAQKTGVETILEVIDSTAQTGAAVEVTVQTASGILMEELKAE